VRAEIKLRDPKAANPTPKVESAWVIVGPPDFAPSIHNVVSMYDLVFGLTSPAPAKTSFTRHVFPVLLRATQMYWVELRAHSGHAPASTGGFLRPDQFKLLKDNDATPGSDARDARETVFGKLRDPATGGGGNMPKLFGPLTLTPVQYEHFRRWSEGTFDADWDDKWQGLPP
jgi:hypothetical protein